MKRITKQEKLKRARKVRAHLAQFVAYQSPAERERILREWGRDPDYAALNQLLFASRELQLLIQDLGGEEAAMAASR